jgi:hypothetical protein
MFCPFEPFMTTKGMMQPKPAAATSAAVNTRRTPGIASAVSAFTDLISAWA